MATDSTSPKIPRPPLKLFVGEETSPLPGATLSEWYWGYFRPVVMLAERRNSAATIAIYDKAIEYWQVVGPATKPLAELTKVDIAQFDLAFTHYHYQRGPLGQPRPVRPVTVFKHVTVICRMLDAAFEEGFFSKRIRYKRSLPVTDRKPACELESCRTIFRNVEQMRLPLCEPRSAIWRLLLALLFYTGLRIGAAMAVRREYFSSRQGLVWLEVPRTANRKTSKEWSGPVHPQLQKLIEAHPSGDLFPPDLYARRDGMLKELKRLCRECQVPQLPFHAWRRAHAEQLSLLGLDTAIDLARQGLQHASAGTTLASYTNPLHVAILRLPWLEVRDERQEQELVDPVRNDAGGSEASDPGSR